MPVLFKINKIVILACPNSEVTIEQLQQMGKLFIILLKYWNLLYLKYVLLLLYYCLIGNMHFLHQ